MTSHLDYDKLFSPRSIAVVGASDNPANSGGQLFGNLKFDFPGPVHPVNARRSVVQGVDALPSLEAVDGPVDLVVVAAPARDVPGVIERAADRGDGAVLVVSSGFAEVGSEGKHLQDEITRLARSHSIPVLGPNCIGFMNAAEKVMANFSMLPGDGRPTPGPVALVSSSGGFGSYVLVKAVMAQTRVGFFASTGNEANITVSHLLRYFVERPEVEVVLTFIEAIRDPGLFVEAAARAVELGKPIVALKVGNAEAAARAAFSHTAAIVGSSAVFDAVCDQYGIIRVSSIDEMVDVGLVLQTGYRMRGNRIGVITVSGGAGVLVADAASKVGLEVPELPEADQAAVAKLIPAFGSPRNPVDTTAAWFRTNCDQVLQAVLDSDAVDAVLPIMWRGDNEQAEAVRQLFPHQSKPIVPVLTHKPELLSALGLPVYGDPVRAVRAVGALWAASRIGDRAKDSGLATPDAARQDKVRRVLKEAAVRPFALETTAKQVLAEYGVPVAEERAVTTAEEAAKAAEELGGAVVLKVLSYDLPHKADVGGVKTGIRGGDAARCAYVAMQEDLKRLAPRAKIEGFLVQRSVPADLELMCGLDRDPLFGPVVACGIGGTLVELLGDPVLLHVPFSFAEAVKAAHSMAGGRISHHSRGMTNEQLCSFAGVVAGLGTLAMELREVRSIDINPIRVSESGLVAVDALMVVG